MVLNIPLSVTTDFTSAGCNIPKGEYFYHGTVNAGSESYHYMSASLDYSDDTDIYTLNEEEMRALVEV